MNPQQVADEVMRLARARIEADRQCRTRMLMATPRLARLLSLIAAAPCAPTVEELVVPSGMSVPNLHRVLGRALSAAVVRRYRAYDDGDDTGTDRRRWRWRWYLTDLGREYASLIADPGSRLMIASGYIRCPVDGWHELPPCPQPEGTEPMADTSVKR